MASASRESVLGVPGISRPFGGVSDGTRTRDRLDHNQELYLLSYAHHVPPIRATFAI
jgi:hypothetical protein